jgi:hypothetical protein
MATRLATTRNNFITVTAVKNDEEQDANTSIGSSSTTSSTETCTTTAEIQRTQLTPVALHHVNLSQVKKSLLSRIIQINCLIFHRTEKNNPPNGTIGQCECD